jgi:SlyX protein
MSDTSIQQRLDALESQLAFQEDTISELNQLLTEQNQELARFKRHLQILALRVDQDDTQDGDQPKDELPPHY